MAGSIRQRGTKSWEVRTVAGKDPVTGRKHYVTRTVRGEHSDAQVALGRLLAEIDEGQHTVQGGAVAELCERWYSNAAPDLSPAVAVEYERLLDKRILPRWGDVPLRRLASGDPRERPTSPLREEDIASRGRSASARVTSQHGRRVRRNCSADAVEID